MTLPAGGRLGPYEVLAPLGAGGMGEVYRARDSRLGRDVALKLLPAEVGSDPVRLRRFEQEARAASGLSHPNIVTVYEVGSAGSTFYIAMELVEGRSLRQLLSSGPLPVKKALDVALAVAEGLACAHQAGVVHRDLKPDNVMVSRDGVVKILDFGLAKRMPSESGAGPESSTMSAATEPGTVVGTVRYMSPEQATGRLVDFRSDQFSFGLVLYEMLTGRAAFRRETNVDTLSAILHEEPEALASFNPRVPPPLRWIGERCLAKEPKSRYASTEDLARELSTVRQHLSEVSSVSELGPAPLRRRRLAFRLGIAIAAAAALVGLGLFVSRSLARPPPQFRQLTFRSAGISTARFTPDEQTVVYSAQWEGSRPELFETRLDQPESRSLGLPASHILSVSPSGEMAVLLLPSYGMASRPPLSDNLLRLPLFWYGTLARAPLVGGEPRELLDKVMYADWAPNGRDLAVIHDVDGIDRLEFPIGKALYESDGWLVHARVSPRGNRVAFQNGATDVLVSDLSGHFKTLASGAWGLAWSPVTGELWYRSYSPSSPGIGTTELRAIGASGKQRLVASLPGNFALHDISASGRLLIARVVESAEIFGSFPGQARDRNLSYFDRSILWDVSASGDTILFGEMGMSRGETTAYIRKTDGSPAKRLGAFGGHGYGPVALSPDGRFVLTTAEKEMILLPTGVGKPIPIPTPGVELAGPVALLPDGKSVLLMGSEPGHDCRFWVQDLAGGRPHPVTPRCPHHPRPRLSGDGRFLCIREDSGAWSLYPTGGGEVHAVVGIQAGEEPIGGTGDGKWLYVRGADELKSGDFFVSARVYRLDPWTGHRELWKEIPPLSPTTGGGISTIRFSADGKTCFYTHHRYSSDLFLAEGLR